MNSDSRFKKYLIIVLIIFAGLFSGVLKAKAATTIYLEREEKDIYEGDVFVVDLKISSPDKSINAIDGAIIYDNQKLEIKEVSSGGSLFVLWPRSPVFSNEKGNLSFVGGTPEGFQGENGKVFKIAFFAKTAGETKIDFRDGFSVFLHDGKGTQINPWLKPLSLNILTRPPEIRAKDEWQVLIESDKNPPEPFEITLGKDPSIFNNQYFISFFATDKESGVKYYEIKEGDKDFIKGESPYLLKDQSLKSIIKVKAVDMAGNERIEELLPIPAPAPTPFYKNIVFWVIILFILFLLIAAGIFFKYQITKSK